MKKAKYHQASVPCALPPSIVINNQLMREFSSTLMLYALYEKGMIPAPYEQLCRVPESDRQFRKISKWLKPMDDIIASIDELCAAVDGAANNIAIEEVSIIFGPSISCGRDIFRLTPQHSTRDDSATVVNSKAAIGRCKRILIRDMITSGIATSSPTAPCRNMYLAIRLNGAAAFVESQSHSVPSFVHCFALRDSLKTIPRGKGRLTDITVSQDAAEVVVTMEGNEQSESQQDPTSSTIPTVVSGQWFVTRKPIKALLVA